MGLAAKAGIKKFTVNSASDVAKISKLVNNPEFIIDTASEIDQILSKINEQKLTVKGVVGNNHYAIEKAQQAGITEDILEIHHSEKLGVKNFSESWSDHFSENWSDNFSKNRSEKLTHIVDITNSVFKNSITSAY